MKISSKFKVLSVLSVSLVLLSLSSPVIAQDSTKPKAPAVKVKPRNLVLRETFAPVAQSRKQHLVTVFCDGSAIGLGTVFETGIVLCSRVSTTGKRGKFTYQAADGTRAALNYIGLDKKTQVAIFKGGPASAAVSLEEIEPLYVGQFVVSVGPNNFPVAAGCVSSLNRKAPATGRGPAATNIFNEIFGGGDDNSGPDFTYKLVVQHDSKVKKSDYGSAVFNADKQFVGLNVERGYRGSSYFIPKSEIDGILSRARSGKDEISEEKDEVVKSEPKRSTPVESPKNKKPGYLGCEATFVEQKSADGAALKNTGYLGGMKVTRVAAGSGAAKVGMEIGDIIVGVNGVTILSFDQFVDQLRDRNQGDQLVLTVVRAGMNKQLTVILGARPK